MKTRLLICSYLFSTVCANLLVKWIGAYGLWFSSFLLIPFDFVVRCFFHERWKGARLVLNLFFLTLAASVITYLFNHSALNIALASICGFASAQIGAGIFYQINKKSTWFIKVNMSDLIAICCDSLLFQYIAFSHINFYVLLGQIVVKFTGGLMWYYILFKRLKLHEKINT